MTESKPVTLAGDLALYLREKYEATYPRRAHRERLARQLSELEALIDEAARHDLSVAGKASMIASALKAELAAHDHTDVLLAGLDGE